MCVSFDFYYVLLPFVKSASSHHSAISLYPITNIYIVTQGTIVDDYRRVCVLNTSRYFGFPLLLLNKSTSHDID